MSMKTPAIPGRPCIPVMTPRSLLAFRKPPCDHRSLAETICRFAVGSLGGAMGFMAPKERQHLSAEALFVWVRNLCANVPDHRRDETARPLTDALRAGVAMVALTCPSLLDCAKPRAAG